MRKFLNNYKSYLITAFIAITLIAVFMVVKNVYPFGEKVIFVSTEDFINQYVGYFALFSKMITSMKMSFFTFNLGIGMPFLNVITTHVTSPINLLIYLLCKDKLLSFSIMMLIKPLLVSLSTLYYLNYKRGKKWSNIIFSLLFAFNAFLLVYISEVMWIDQLIYLPLLTMGIEELIDKNDKRLYIISLLLIMLTNYYTAYMLCVYSLIYFSLYLFIYRKYDKKKAIFDFIKSSLLCALLCSFLYLPLLNVFKNTNLLVQNYIIDHVEFGLLDFICAHFNRLTPSYSINDNVAPNIFCGVSSLVLLIIYICNRKIDKKEKKLLLMMLTIFYLLLRVNVLNYVMHFFHHPNGIFYRFSFIYSFILMLIGSSSITKIKDLESKDFNLSLIIMSIILIILGLLMPNKLTLTILLINTGLIVLYFVIFKLSKTIKYMKYVFSAVCIIEIFVYMMFNIPIGNTDYNAIYDSSRYDYIKSYDTDIYRIHSHNNFITVGSAINDYYGFNNYNSTINSNVTNMFINLGILNNNINGYIYSIDNPMLNTMFGIKYILSDVPTNDTYYDNVISNIYVNKYFKSLAYTTNTDLLNLEINQDNPIDIFNDYAYLSTGVKNLFEEVKYDNNTLDFNGEETIYAYLNNNFDKMVIDGYTYTNNKSVNSCFYYDNNLTNMNTDLFYFEKGSSYKITFYYKDNNKEKVKYYKINNKKFKEFYNKLGDAKIVEFNNDNIKLSTKVDKETLIYTSIPYEEGWKVFVDGKEANKEKVMNALLAIKVDKGEHVIDIKYEEPNYNIGVYITSALLIILSINSIRVIIKDREDE